MAKTSGKLTLLDACGMAIGGMVGGGIFAVMGEAVVTAGNAAFLSLGFGGLLALATGLVYARLTVEFDEPGGGFAFIEHAAGAQAAGMASWFLILGYAFTISLYAYTFGAYFGRLIGLESGPNAWLGAGIVVLAAAFNLTGVRASGLFEDVLVYSKIFILSGLIIVGFINADTSYIFPIVSQGPFQIIVAAALVFVAYEGFQLLTYDYDDIRDHKRNLPRAIVLSIVIVIGLYMLIAFVLTGSLSPQVIADHKETVLAMVAEPVLGRLGVVLVLVAATFSTSSAVLATLFATSRLARRVARDRQLPRELTDWSRAGTPVIFTLLIAFSSIAVQWFGNLRDITTFSSLVFLLIFAVVNWVGYRHRVFKGKLRWIPLAAGGGCLGAAIVLLRDLYNHHLPTLYVIAAIIAAVLVLRWLYSSLHPDYEQRRER
ncbi:MAG TPA: APC family permease [Acidobacteriota bacterium]|nr:APC family permease [Acidobacteriota bacterium]